MPVLAHPWLRACLNRNEFHKILGHDCPGVSFGQHLNDHPCSDGDRVTLYVTHGRREIKFSIGLSYDFAKYLDDRCGVGVISLPFRQRAPGSIPGRVSSPG